MSNALRWQTCRGTPQSRCGMRLAETDRVNARRDRQGCPLWVKSRHPIARCSKNEIALHEAVEVIGEIVHVDLEIGLTIAVDVALHGHVGAVLDEMQLASFVVKLSGADEVECM